MSQETQRKTSFESLRARVKQAQDRAAETRISAEVMVEISQEARQNSVALRALAKSRIKKAEEHLAESVAKMDKRRGVS